MNESTNHFTSNGEGNNLKAILFSILASVVLLCFFALLSRSEPPAKRCVQTNTPSPTPTASPQVQAETRPPDPNEKFRIVPSNFTHVDFRNRSYGAFRSLSQAWIDLKLTDGSYDYNDGYVVMGGGETFDLSDIYFTDVTGDEIPEAIVLIWHVQCGVSCDGGNIIVFVYATHGNSLKQLWQYETGSYAYGCGFKSLTVMKKRLALQVFGKCYKPQMDSNSRKYVVPNETHSYFRLSGNRFIKTGTEFFSVPDRDLHGYKPQVHIIE